MDEVRMVRDLYPEPTPPTAREVARAKALLAGPPRRTVPRASPRLRWGLGGLLAAAAAATLAITLTGGSPPPSSPVDLIAPGTVLAAAERAERRPTGRYWHSDQVYGHSYVVRSKAGTYAITGVHWETFAWWGARTDLGRAAYSRDLPARPQSERDAELWREDGSPSSFRVWTGDRYATYTTGPAKAQWRKDALEPQGGGRFPGAARRSVTGALRTGSAFPYPRSR
jgi:hypothetical protein